MGNAVIAIPRKDILFEYGVEDQGDVQCWHVSPHPGRGGQIDSPSRISNSPEDQHTLHGQPQQMDERREREQLLVLVDVDVRREYGDQKSDDASGSEPGIPGHQQQDAEDDFDHTARQDQRKVKRQVRGHDLQEEVCDNEVADACNYEKGGEDSLADEIPETS